MEKNFELPHVLTAGDICKHLNISKSKAYELFKLEGFPVLAIGGTKRVYKEDFLNWVESQKATNKIERSM